jgi:hypothetical protein
MNLKEIAFQGVESIQLRIRAFERANKALGFIKSGEFFD